MNVKRTNKPPMWWMEKMAEESGEANGRYGQARVLPARPAAPGWYFDSVRILPRSPALFRDDEAPNIGSTKKASSLE